MSKFVIILAFRMSYAFEGNFRNRPEQNLSGSSKKTNRDTLLQRAHEERQKRQVRMPYYFYRVHIKFKLFIIKSTFHAIGSALEVTKHRTFTSAYKELFSPKTEKMRGEVILRTQGVGYVDT